MLPAYFTSLLGIVHLVRFTSLLVLLIMAEIKIGACGTHLNEFLGYNQPSIVYYCILIWISFAFELYLLINRLFAALVVRARTAVQVLYATLCFGYLLASSFTLYALISAANGHMITQPDFWDQSDNVIKLPANCNPYRLVGIVCGYVIGALYLIALVLMHRRKE